MKLAYLGFALVLASPAFAGGTVQQIIAERRKEEAECLKDATKEAAQKMGTLAERFQFCLDDNAQERIRDMDNQAMEEIRRSGGRDDGH
jgi:hypothetical protein